MAYHERFSAKAAALKVVSPRAAGATHRPGGSTRPFRDPDSGVFWTVSEVDGRSIPGARGSRCLVFHSESAIRRVWCYPDDWRTLGDADLAALSWQR